VTRPLAEIIEEGESMNAPNWTGPRGYRDVWWAEHGPRLLVVAKAAVEVVDADESEGWCRTLDARLALRTAVRGDALASGAAEGERS